MMDIEKLFGDSALHDCKMEKIEIDYPKGTILLQFLTPKNEINKIIIRQFFEIEFTNKEEWGKGTYVVSSDVFNSGDIINIEFQFNSGDICKIKSYK
ncbi:MAG: hypothetical protein ACI4AQ_04225 [Lachnospiraceae bacterium]